MLICSRITYRVDTILDHQVDIRLSDERRPMLGKCGIGRRLTQTSGQLELVVNALGAVAAEAVTTHASPLVDGHIRL